MKIFTFIIISFCIWFACLLSLYYMSKESEQKLRTAIENIHPPQEPLQPSNKIETGSFSFEILPAPNRDYFQLVIIINNRSYVSFDLSPNDLTMLRQLLESKEQTPNKDLYNEE